MTSRTPKLDPDTLVDAYCNGAFPMADLFGRIQWYTADPRGILPLEAFHVPRTLRQIVRQNRFEIRIDHDFREVMRQCGRGRDEGSWITEELVHAYAALHDLGLAHSVEAWQDGRLAGGLYGVSLGGAFFGESMFHHVSHASKIALVHLVERLRQRGYQLLDTQATTSHLERFGAIAIPADDYMQRLHEALGRNCSFA